MGLKPSQLFTMPRGMQDLADLKQGTFSFNACGVSEGWGHEEMQADSSLLPICTSHKPLLSTQSWPSSPAGMSHRCGCCQELPLFWAKDKKECRLLSRFIQLHMAYSSRARPVLVGLRAALWPARLRLPVMSTAIRGLAIIPR